MCCCKLGELVTDFSSAPKQRYALIIMCVMSISAHILLALAFRFKRNSFLLTHSYIFNIVGSLCDREVACSTSDHHLANLSSPGSVQPICAQRWPKTPFIRFLTYVYISSPLAPRRRYVYICTCTWRTIHALKKFSALLWYVRWTSLRNTDRDTERFLLT